MMATHCLDVPSISAVDRRPLSTHGMAKSPRNTSPEQPHRFSGLGVPPTSTMSGYASPGSPGPMSPPTSARSFGTLIDSEPSTPAYSPRMDYDWDSSNWVLLRPMSSSSEPSSPTEPAWTMMSPMKMRPQAVGLTSAGNNGPFCKMGMGTRLASPPVKKIKASHKSKSRPPHEVKVVDQPQKELDQPYKEGDDEVKALIDAPIDSNPATFGKLASKMKHMLRRRSTNSDKKREKKEKNYYDPEEDLHWTER